MDLAVISLDLEDESGLALLNILRAEKQPPQIVVTSKCKRFDAAVTAMRLGAADYLAKPLQAKDVADRIDQAVKRFNAEQKKDQRLRRLKRRRLGAGLHETQRTGS